MEESTIHGQQRWRCLITEKHDWETGGDKQQLQLLLDVAEDFFGSGKTDRDITVRVYLPPEASAPSFVKQITISRVYGNATRRINGFPELGAVPAAFVFFQETDRPNEYDCWWEIDKAIVAARYGAWRQGKNSQHGRGRLSVIVAAPVPRGNDRID